MEKLPKALAFDLDGTLTPSKSHLESNMSDVLVELLKYVPVAVISGASKQQFDEQFLKYLPKSADVLSNLYLFPENGGELVEYRNGKWTIDYEKKLDKESEKEITDALEAVIVKFNLKETEGFGNLIEDRGEQITLSALGQKAPLELKEKWDSDQSKRREIIVYLKTLLPEFEIRIGGATSIDITKKGINKAFGMNYFIKILKIDKGDLLYFGDALFPGGNDEIVKINGFNCQTVNNSEETLSVLRGIIKLYGQVAYK